MCTAVQIQYSAAYKVKFLWQFTINMQHEDKKFMIERSRVRIPAGTAGEFSSPGSTFCADSYFGIRSTPVLPQ